MAPKDLAEYGDASLTLGARVLGDAPSSAVTVAQFVAQWSFIDIELTLLVSDHLLEADFEVALEFVAQLAFPRRQRTIRRVARKKLPAADAKLIEDVLETLHPLADFRHACVHHLWGKTPKEPTALILVEPRSMAREVAAKMGEQDSTKIVRTGRARPSGKVYFKGDLDDLLLQAQKALRHLRALGLALGGDVEARSALLSELQSLQVHHPDQSS